jgi:hypothetical protein
MRACLSFASGHTTCFRKSNVLSNLRHLVLANAESIGKALSPDGLCLCVASCCLCSLTTAASGALMRSGACCGSA